MKAVSVLTTAIVVTLFSGFTSAAPINVPEGELTKRTSNCEGTLCNLPTRPERRNVFSASGDLLTKPAKRLVDDGAGDNVEFKQEKRAVVCPADECNLHPRLVEAMV
jgi:hypothetical protein